MIADVLKDGDISRGCRQDDPEAWRALIRTYTPLVYRIAYRMLRDRGEAEDASQEVFMRVCRSITSHDPTRPLSPWLARICYRICLKRLSTAGQAALKERALDEEDLPDEEKDLSPERRADEKQVSAQIDHALNRLPAQDRALIVMRYREGFTDTEIAEATRMPVGTVKTRLHRARGKLRRFLAPFFSEGIT